MSHSQPAGRWRWLLVVCYAGLMGLVVWSMRSGRQWALAELATPASVADWQAWREDVQHQQREPSPVRRRVPASTEPPALVLMRDHFAVMLGGAVVLTSALYWVTAWLAVGALTSSHAPDHDSRRNSGR